MTRAVAVVDIGKSNVKLALFAPDGTLLWERSTPNSVLAGPPYPHADVATTWSFVLAALRDANATHPIEAIVPTTHACAGAFIDEGNLVLPVMDYEFGGVEEIEPFYALLRPPYAETLSPKLPRGLNLGKQIAWQRARFPEVVARAKHYLTYPQYWSWRLSGVAASEVTMQGAHTDLWAPLRRGPSSLAAKLDLPRLMPPFRSAWDRLGVVKAEVAALTGVGRETSVLCGVHDSNASLLPHLASREPPFTIVSTGTWVILMAPGIGLDRLEEADDMLANVDVEGRPVACARFMGGREYGEIVGDARGNPDEASLARVIKSGVMALPSFAAQGGPFASRKGQIHGKVAIADRPALATLYVALMSNLMLTRLGANAGDLIIEGSFAANASFCQSLAAMRVSQRVFAGSDAAGTARGAALLAQWPIKKVEPTRQNVVPSREIESLSVYKRAWLRALDAIEA